MFISSRCKSGLFCFLSLLLFVVISVDGQLLDENAANKNGQEVKINSIKVNKIVTSDSLEQPASDSDRVVLSKKYTSLNSKYVTQSPETSGLNVGLFMGPKKSE